MKYKFLKLSSFLFTLSILTSCNIDNVMGFRGNKYLLSPVGAPTLAIYNEVALNEEVETTSQTSNISAAFLSNEYKYLVFDAINGQNIIETKKANYKFVKLLTGGNIHLIGINKEEGSLPTKDDYIIGFGNENSTPVKTFRKLFPNAINDKGEEVSTFDRIFNNVTELGVILKTINENGMIPDSQTSIDWALVAYPDYLNSLNQNENLKNIVTIDINLKDYFEEKFNLPYIPQAGLFVHNLYLQSNKKEVNTLLNYIDLMQYNAIYNSNAVINTLGNLTNVDLSTRFGFTLKEVEELQKSITIEEKTTYTNLFGVVEPYKEYSEKDLKEFKEIISPTPAPSPEQNNNE